MNNKKNRNFTERILHLISEPQFIDFENIIREPNIFKVVGHTHYERWHSCFLGWLLDKNGTHLLSEYSLIRFFLMLLDNRCLKSSSHNLKLFDIIPVLDFDEIDVTPNEYLSKEMSVSGVGRFDIFITANYHVNNHTSGKINCLIELKIDSNPNPIQSKKYADWLYKNHPNDVNFLVYLTPVLGSDSKETVGDDRWYCLDYQLLHDKLLIPLVNHPNLNEKVKPYIIQYMKNLKNRYRGRKMAITEEEKRMAVLLYEKYSDVFDSIYEALSSEGIIDYSISDVGMNGGRMSGKLSVKLDNKIFTNDTIRLLFHDILKYIVDKKYILKIPLPWGTSNQRYIITNEKNPQHPSGRNFFYPVKYMDYTMESHYARDRGLKVLSDLCKKLEMNFEIIDS